MCANFEQSIIICWLFIWYIKIIWIHFCVSFFCRVYNPQFLVVRELFYYYALYNVEQNLSQVINENMLITTAMSSFSDASYFIVTHDKIYLTGQSCVVKKPIPSVDQPVRTWRHSVLYDVFCLSRHTWSCSMFMPSPLVTAPPSIWTYNICCVSRGKCATSNLLQNLPSKLRTMGKIEYQGETEKLFLPRLKINCSRIITIYPTLQTLVMF